MFNRRHHHPVLPRVIGRISSVSLQKSEFFSGSRTQPGSDSQHQYAANVRLLSPQLIKTESSFDLSGADLVGSGPVPGAACVDGGKMCSGRENLVNARRNGEMDEWIYGSRRGIEAMADGGIDGGRSGGMEEKMNGRINVGDLRGLEERIEG